MLASRNSTPEEVGTDSMLPVSRSKFQHSTLQNLPLLSIAMSHYKCAVDHKNMATELPLLRVCGSASENPHMRAFWASTIPRFARCSCIFCMFPLVPPEGNLPKIDVFGGAHSPTYGGLKNHSYTVTPIDVTP